MAEGNEDGEQFQLVDGDFPEHYILWPDGGEELVAPDVGAASDEGRVRVQMLGRVEPRPNDGPPVGTSGGPP